MDTMPGKPCRLTRNGGVNAVPGPHIRPPCTQPILPCRLHNPVCHVAAPAQERPLSVPTSKPARHKSKQVQRTGAGTGGADLPAPHNLNPDSTTATAAPVNGITYQSATQPVQLVLWPIDPPGGHTPSHPTSVPLPSPSHQHPDPPQSRPQGTLPTQQQPPASGPTQSPVAQEAPPRKKRKKRVGPELRHDVPTLPLSQVIGNHHANTEARFLSRKTARATIAGHQHATNTPPTVSQPANLSSATQQGQPRPTPSQQASNAAQQQGAKGGRRARPPPPATSHNALPTEQTLAQAWQEAEAAVAAAPISTLTNPSHTSSARSRHITAPQPHQQPHPRHTHAAPSSGASTALSHSPQSSPIHTPNSLGPISDYNLHRHQVYLTTTIRHTPDWQSLFACLHSALPGTINHIHTAAAWKQLVKLHMARQQSGVHQHAGDKQGNKVMLSAAEMVDHLGGGGVGSDAGQGGHARSSDLLHDPRVHDLMLFLDGLSLHTANAMQPREASSVLWAMACLKHLPRPEVVNRLLQALLHESHKCNDQDLTLSIWAIGKLMTKGSQGSKMQAPGSPQALLKHFDYQQLPDSHRDDENVRRAAGAKGMQSSVDQRSGFMHEPQHMRGEHMYGGGPDEGEVDDEEEVHASDTQYVGIMSSLGGSRLALSTQDELTAQDKLARVMHQSIDQPVTPPLPSVLLQQLSHLVVDRLGAMSDQCLAMSMHGLSMVHVVAVPRPLIAHALHVAGSRAHALNPRDLSTVLSSMVHMGCRPEETWLKSLVVQFAHMLPHYKCEEVVMFLYSCSVIKFRPAPQLLTDIARHTIRRLATSSMYHLALLMWAFSKLQWRPPSEWLEVYLQEVVERRHELAAHEISLVMYSLAVMRYVPDPPVMQALLERLVVVLPDPGILPMQLSTICWSLPLLTPDVGNEARVIIRRAATKHRRKLTAEGLAKVLWCMARCAVVPPPRPWLELMLQEFHRRVGSMCPHSMSLAFWALAKMGYHHRKVLFTNRVMQRLWRVARPKMPAMQLQSMVSLLHASAWVDYAPESEILQEFADCVSLHYASMTSETLQGVTSVLWGMRQRRNRILERVKVRKERKALKLEGVDRKRSWHLPLGKRIAPKKVVEWRPVGWAVRTKLSGGGMLTLKGRKDKTKKGNGK